MPDLDIRIKRKNDGSAALTCTRPDGTSTWQQQNGPQGRFFPLHDLTHFAVETTLGFRRAFYGLVAEGWDITFFADPAARDQLPAEALLAELIVGYLDLERATGVLATADELNEKIVSYHADKSLPPVSFRLTQQQLDNVRSRRAELFERWNSLSGGEALDLSFAL